MPIITGIIWTHRFSAPPSWFDDEHAKQHAYHGIIYLLEGQVSFLFKDGRTICLTEGQCLYIPQGALYIVRGSPEVPFIHMTVNFTLAEPDLFGNMPVCKHLTNSVRFVQVFSKLVHIWTTRHAFYEERCMGLLYELIYLLEKETCTNISPYLDKISPACQYLKEHFTEAGSSVQLSELCGMSPAYLRRLFRLALGETPSEYKCRLRIALAKELLLSRQLSVAQVASMCGFADEAYFSRVFQKNTGTPPSRYFEKFRTDEDNRKKELAKQKKLLKSETFLPPDS